MEKFAPLLLIVDTGAIHKGVSAKNFCLRPKLSRFLVERNAYEYRVCAHGVKSSSLSVGFSELAAQALVLENAAREEDWDFILANHNSFIAEYQTAAGAVRKALGL